MQKKRNIKFRAVDLAIVLLCLAGSAASGAAFWQEYNRTLTKLNEEPIGTIVFKKRTAQRRFIDRVVWDRLRQASPVYNGDMIRTIELSEAVITFQDEVTHLTLDENTIIQIFYSDLEGARIDFSGGNLEVNASSKKVVISSGSSAIIVEGQAKLNKSQEGFRLSVVEGQASYDGSKVEPGTILALDNKGERSTIPAIAMTSFGPSARFLTEPEKTVPVVFSWNTSNFNPDTHVIVEVTMDRGFTRVLETKDISGAVTASVSLGSGSYWWRVYPANGGSREPATPMYPYGTLDIVPGAAVVLFYPARAAEFTGSTETSIPFSWSAVEGASAYKVDISANANMSSPIVSRRVEENYVTQTGLGNGRWYWRITPVFPSWINGSVPPSGISDFSVVQGRPVLSEPALTYPAQNGKIYLGAAGHRLLWVKDPNATSWLVEVADNQGIANPVVRQEVSSNYYSLPQELLQNGKTWYWRITARGGANPTVSAVRNFDVAGGTPPSTEPVLAVTAPPPVQTPIRVVPEQPPPLPAPAKEPVATVQPPPSLPPPPRPVVLSAPVLTLPSQGGTIFLDSSSRKLSWTFDARAASWQVEVADNQGMINPVVRQNVRANSYTLRENVLQAGKTWYWRVTALGGDSPVASVVRNFDVKASAAPAPEPIPEPAPEPPPVVEPVKPEPPPVQGNQLARLTQVTHGTVFECFPANGSAITTGQLQNAQTVTFTWEGKSAEYRFALYKINGEEVVPVSAATGSSYSLSPRVLTEGDYVWQVYEKGKRGNWEQLPVAANRFSVIRGQIKTLPAQNPGTLYGNR